MLVKLIYTIGRPCQRCIKRSIGHLCHDEIKTPSNSNSKSNGSSASSAKKTSTYVEPPSSVPAVVPQHVVGKDRKRKNIVTLTCI